MAKNTLKGRLADNTITVDDKTDKILKLEVTRSVDEALLLDRMVQKNPGIRREIMQATLSLFHETIAEAVCNGESVNTDLCHFVARFTGVIHNNAWDNEKNSIYVSIHPGKRLMQEIADTTVKILPEVNTAYISAGEDSFTHAQDFSATAGRNYTLLGKNIKIKGNDPAVGITLTDSKGAVTRFSADMMAVNTPSKLVLLLPAELPHDVYTLTLTTQYSSSGVDLKTPRVVTHELYVR
jgi:hypothetical protein